MTDQPPLRVRLKIYRQRLSRTRAARMIAAFAMACYIRFVYLTCRRAKHYHPDVPSYLAGEKNAIFAFWHGRLLLVPPFRPKTRPMYVLISLHNDGELITRVLEHFGIMPIRGSSSSGGGNALRQAITHFKAGDNIAITPDGPRGPNGKVQQGAVALARICGAPIIPVAVSGSRHRILHKSWDRMQIPKPFGTLGVAMGEPLFVPKDADEAAVETHRLALETALDRVMMEADAAAGIPPTTQEPA